MQLIAYPLALLLGLAVVAPLAVLALNSLGDITDAQAGISLPRSLKRYLGPDAFYVRYLHQRYEGLPELALNHWYPEHYAPPEKEPKKSLTDIIGRVALPPGNWRQQAEDATACMRDRVPWNHKELIHLSWMWNPDGGDEAAIASSGRIAADWRTWLVRRYGSVAGVNKELATAFTTIQSVQVPTTLNLETENAYMLGTPAARAWKEYLAKGVDPNLVSLLSSDLDYSGWLFGQPGVEGSLEKLNALFGTGWKTWHDVVLPESIPVRPASRRMWEEYLTTSVNPYVLEIAYPTAQGTGWSAFLARKYGSAEGARAAYAPEAVSAVPPATLDTADGTERGFHDWSEFARSLPGTALRARTPESVWRGYLRETYGSPQALAAAWGIPVPDFESVLWPQPAIDLAFYRDHRVAHILEGLFHNYRRAWTMMTAATPALWNTLRYTGLALFLCLALNTGIAWCLARFKFPPLQMTLAYFLALSAFPLEAMAIPNFILLRQVGLLNTVWALALPTAVNGYFIYLLKSSFEAIPASWFESAQLEGAGEWPLFFQVALPAVRPMLAVVALYGFMLAWSNFLWAMIVGQSRELWTLPVLIFTMHNWNTAPSLVSAALVLMTLPPLVLYLLANRTLQRGLTAKVW